MKITDIKAREILDSRGNPTLEVSMMNDKGQSVVFGVPSGASTGEKEALERRDGDINRYNGMGVKNCVDEIENNLKEGLMRIPLGDQSEFDGALATFDPSEKKEKLGANTMLGLSGAYLKLSALSSGQKLWQYISEISKSGPSLPRIYANLINGGKHAPGLDIQEVMVVPKETRPSVAVEQIVSFRRELAKKLSEEYGESSLLIGDEGGFVPQNARHAKVLAIFSSIEGDFEIALDVAASSFYENGKYHFEGKDVTAEELGGWYQANSNNILSVEDPFEEHDSESFANLASNASFFVIGDDLTVTSATLIDEFATKSAISGVIIKPNQIGTISETLAAVAAAQASDVKIIVSHRSGETNDDFIADLACGIGAFGIKIGAPVRGERVAKYNRLLQIEKEGL
ncbi:phosphopyruvate hydratase [Candidatus Saccharibacteria bacterium CPR2]|nr:phosphopyruvate hydratase [Candidatus Saccharibacteria bacterium CPR2]